MNYLLTLLGLPGDRKLSAEVLADLFHVRFAGLHQGILIQRMRTLRVLPEQFQA